MKNLALMLFLFVSIQGYSQTIITGTTGTTLSDENCDDCIDNDGDGLVDCADPDCLCRNSISCAPTSTFYQTRDGTQVQSGRELHQYDPVTMQFTNNPITNSFGINAIGYNVQDGFIYGIKESSNHLVRVGSNGVYQDLGSIAGLSNNNLTGDGKSYYVGDFDLAGNLYVIAPESNPNVLFRISVGCNPSIAQVNNLNVQTIQMTMSLPVGQTMPNIMIADFSFLPATQLLYGLRNVTGELYSVNPNTGEVINLGIPQTSQGTAISCGSISTPSSGFGASYADINGSLYFFCNVDGNLYKVDNLPASSSPPIYRLLQATGITLEANDGASCALSSGPLPTEYCCYGQNLIPNGNFESNNVGFSSEYGYVAPGQPVVPNTYSVIDYTTASSICTNWDVEDHTHCITGNNNRILVVNGETQQSTNSQNAIWQTAQPITIQEGEEYKFCLYANHLEQCCFNIIPEIRIERRENNGTAWQPISNWTPITGTSRCNWKQVEGIFTAYSNTVEFRVLIKETGIGDGNDLALDDISLTVKADCETDRKTDKRK